jgi:hypothetical protein
MKISLPAVSARLRVTSTLRNMECFGSFSNKSGLRSAAQWIIACGYINSFLKGKKKNFSKMSTCKSWIIAFVSSKLVRSHRIKCFLFARLSASPE